MACKNQKTCQKKASTNKKGDNRKCKKAFQNGKGDSLRTYTSPRFRLNYDRIFPSAKKKA